MYCTVERGRERDNGEEMGKGKDRGMVVKGREGGREGIRMSPEQSKNMIVKEIVE